MALLVGLRWRIEVVFSVVVLGMVILEEYVWVVVVVVVVCDDDGELSGVVFYGGGRVYILPSVYLILSCCA